MQDCIPVGAVIVKNNNIIYAARNGHGAIEHAEKLCIEHALGESDGYLLDCTLYVTLEPCAMCAGMMIWSRLGRLVIGAMDPKTGAVGSVYNLLRDKQMNHHPQVSTGVMQTECSKLLTGFFREKRLNKQNDITKPKD